jgi:hypothetical protein
MNNTYDNIWYLLKSQSNSYCVGFACKVFKAKFAKGYYERNLCDYHNLNLNTLNLQLGQLGLAFMDKVQCKCASATLTQKVTFVAHGVCN